MTGDAPLLFDEWMPALGVRTAGLDYGGIIADLACGDGARSISLAKRFPLATVRGFDMDATSVDAASRAASDAGVSARCSFSVTRPDEVPAASYDLLCLFAGLRGVADPVAVARRCRKVVRSDGVVVLLEAVPAELGVFDVLREAGFDAVEVVATTGSQLVLAARP